MTRVNTSNTLACARPQVTVFKWSASYSTVFSCCVYQRRHFSCSRAGMLMFQPIACRSKPHVNRLHDWFSSFHAVQHTIRLWPCTHTHTHTFKLLVLTLTTTQTILSTLFASSPFCCCVEVWPASLRSCQTVGPVDCHVAERWSSGWRRHLFWKIRSRSDLNLGQVLVRLLSKLSCTPAVWSLILQYFTFSLFWNIIQHCVYINISSTNWLWQDFTF